MFPTAVKKAGINIHHQAMPPYPDATATAIKLKKKKFAIKSLPLQKFHPEFPTA
jgi:hypothetical protein